MPRETRDPRDRWDPPEVMASQVPMAWMVPQEALDQEGLRVTQEIKGHLDPRVPLALSAHLDLTELLELLDHKDLRVPSGLLDQEEKQEALVTRELVEKQAPQAHRV